MKDDNLPSSPHKIRRQNLPAFHRRYKFLLLAHIVLFMVLFLCAGVYHLISLDHFYWEMLKKDLFVYSRLISLSADKIIDNPDLILKDPVAAKSIQNLDVAICVFDKTTKTHVASAIFAHQKNFPDVKRIFASDMDRISVMPQDQFVEFGQLWAFSTSLSGSKLSVIFMLLPSSLWDRILDQESIYGTVLYGLMLIIFVSTMWVMLRQFILPANRLMDYIIASHRGIKKNPVNLSGMPLYWKPWFNIITWVFDTIRSLENKIQAKNIDQQLGTNLLRRFSWVFERNENLARELQAKNIELEKEIEQHKKTTIELERHRDHLNELVRERASDLYHANTRLEAAIKKADAANQAKSEFLATVSHAIRAPLTAVIGFSELLTETELNETQKDLMHMVHSRSNSLLKLINNILDLSKIESDEITLESVEFSLEVLAYDVLETIRPLIRKKPVEISCQIDEKLPSYVKGDLHRIEQMLINLFDNAAKFTEAGDIILSLSCEQEKDERIFIHFKVTDTGIGISPEKLEVIFDPFQQAEGSTTRKFGGTGLGLSIVRKTARIMGGDAWVESEIDVGSTFHCTAWFEKSYKKESWPELAAELSEKQILIAENNKVSLKMLVDVLKSAKIKVVDLNNGVEVFPTLDRAIVAGKPFDCCIIDIAMPGMNGYNIAQKIRTSKIQKLEDIALIASSYIAERDPLRFAQAGFDQSIIKPVRREKLFQVLNEVLIKGPSVSSMRIHKEAYETGYLEKPAAKKAKILVAEDDFVNQKLLNIMLQNAGYTVTLVSNGREAVDVIIENPYFYDIIFLDIRMPVMNGLDASRMIRKINPTVPIIALTAHIMRDQQAECREAGMNDYLEKPLTKETLMEMLNKYRADRPKS